MSTEKQKAITPALPSTNLNKVTVLSEEDAARLYSRRLMWDISTVKLFRYTLLDRDNRGRMLSWINDNTTGRFFLSGSLVGFEEEADELIFKLRFKCE